MHRHIGWALTGLAASLLLPSTGQVAKYAGPWAIVPLLAAGALALWLATGPALRWLRRRVSPPGALAVACLAFVALIAAFALVHPLADEGALGSGGSGGGSDRDDALDLAASRLLDGRHPYAERTYLGNPISPLPGAVLLALPFTLLGTSALQNLVWLAALFAWMRRHLGDARSALLAALAVTLSPAVLAEVLTGGDLPANAIYVLLAIVAVARTAAGPRTGPALLAAALLGLALSSRIQFALLLPLVAAAAWRQGGPRRATAQLATTVATFAAVTLPFYAWRPADFSPLTTANELAPFETLLPGAGWIAAGAAGLLAVALARSPRVREPASLLGRAALVQAVPVALLIGLSLIATGRLDPKLPSFGVFFLFFGAVGTWERATGSGRRDG